MAQDAEERGVSRRHILAVGAAAGTVALTAAPALARNSVEWLDSGFSWGRAKITVARTLTLRHTHTGESLDVAYYENGRYLPDALEAVNYFLRDFRTGDVTEIDPRLLDQLHAVRVQTETSEPFAILSAYRSPETNAMLRRRGWGVARNSLHMRGMAVDIRLPDRDARNIARCALAMERGGVGFYPRSNFVHLDTGSFRTWVG